MGRTATAGMRRKRSTRLLVLAVLIHQEKAVADPDFSGIKDQSCWAKCTAGERRHSLPIISGDTFRCWADVVVDETNNYSLGDEEIDMLNTMADRRPIIFLKPDNADKFFNNYHSRINNKYILLTHNSDYDQPWPHHLKYLDDPKMIHWFAQNPLISNHTKLSPLPIGLENFRHNHFAGPMYLFVRKQACHQEKRPQVLLNFRPRNEERQQLVKRFSNISWTVIEDPSYIKYMKQGEEKPSGLVLHERFLLDVAQYRYAISPKGNGLDCHRTWELLAIGVIPVMLHSNLDAMFQDLPILLVHDWGEVTLDKLDSHWKEYGQVFARSKDIPKAVTMTYWEAKILNYARIDNEDSRNGG